jgi:serine/threonine-protein kinase
MSNPQSDKRPIVGVGEILAGKYRVERELGKGGMGVVVAATHLDLQEVRAIKLMRPDGLADRQFVERFLREARAAVRLRSEHVAEVYDVGRLESGAPYIVMELLEGQDLSALLKQKGPLPIEDAVLYIMQACDAVAEAHGLGIVHRDLKPANLFLTRRDDGSPCIKVLDFGISKHILPEGDGAEDPITVTNAVMGSPMYMSPEQMRSARHVDARADIWSLGAILYKLLTGRGPFQVSNTAEIFAAVLDGRPARPPSTLRPDLPSGLEAVILRCLEKDPDRRYDTAIELLAALGPYGPRSDDVDDEAATIVRSPARARIEATAAAPALPGNAGPGDVAPIGEATGSSGASWGHTRARLRGRGHMAALGGALAIASLVTVILFGLRRGHSMENAARAATPVAMARIGLKVSPRPTMASQPAAPVPQPAIVAESAELRREAAAPQPTPRAPAHSNTTPPTGGPPKSLPDPAKKTQPLRPPTPPSIPPQKPFDPFAGGRR